MNKAFFTEFIKRIQDFKINQITNNLFLYIENISLNFFLKNI